MLQLTSENVFTMESQNVAMPESETRKMVCLLEFALKFYYAKSVIENVGSIAISMCTGCEIGHPSQEQHSCLMLSQEEKCMMYFDEALIQLNEEVMLSQWLTEVKTMNIPAGIIDLFSMKVFCKDWRETRLKTDVWKNKLFTTAVRLIRLENRFQ